MGLLPTPNAAEGEKYTTIYNPDSQMGKGLTAMALSNLLPTPTVMEDRRKPNGDTARQKKLMSNLNPFSIQELLSTPRANKVNGLDLNNEALANRDKGNLEEAVAKIVTSCPPTDGATSQLNPLFVEEMMGFPLDWLVSPFQDGGRRP